jgi:diguanylate cyclase (GGDEF)-like protein
VVIHLAPNTHRNLSEALSQALVFVANRSQFLDTRIIVAPPESMPKNSELKIRLQLTEALQRSLDPEELLSIFFTELHQLVPIDGLSYLHEIANIRINVAEHTEHLFTYNLITPKEHFGELKISKSVPFLDEELDLLHSHLDVIVYPLKNALNFRDAINASMKDPLTGAGNRIALTNALHHGIELAKRYQQTMAVLMLDMDNFKSINDMFGHSQGDDVLISVVETMIEDVRTSDSVFRYGGEEFVILLSNTTLNRANHIAERLRVKIEALTLEEDGIRIMTTSSIGIAMLKADETMSKLLARADGAMYEAKRAGRNQVKIAE